MKCNNQSCHQPKSANTHITQSPKKKKIIIITLPSDLQFSLSNSGSGKLTRKQRFLLRCLLFMHKVIHLAHEYNATNVLAVNKSNWNWTGVFARLLRPANTGQSITTGNRPFHEKLLSLCGFFSSTRLVTWILSWIFAQMLTDNKCMLHVPVEENDKNETWTWTAKTDQRLCVVHFFLSFRLQNLGSQFRNWPSCR